MTGKPSSPGLGVSRLHFPITSLGHGRRIGLWTQGCSIRCKGCMSLDTWAPSTDVTPIDALLCQLEPWLENADGLTISGGEPFDQDEGLTALLRAVRPRLNGDVLVFTGYAFNAIPAVAASAFIFIDALVCGPFEEARATALPLRGSANQEFRMLTPLGGERYGALDKIASNASRIDLVHDTAGLWFAGIPKPGDLARLNMLLKAHSVSLKTSSGRFGGSL